MTREKIIFISLKDSAINYFSDGLFKNIVDNFLKENKDIIVSDLITTNNLEEVYLEIMSGNLEHVKDNMKLYRVIERIYDYWRQIKRYYYVDLAETHFVNKYNFIKLFDRANDLVIDSYRNICANLCGKSFTIYRQLPAAGNAIVLFDRTKTVNYQKLDDIRFISYVAFKTPFVVYSKSNTRKGVFPILKENPMDSLVLDKKKWYAYPALVGNSHIFVYFEESYFSLALSLANLFEHDSNYQNQKPDGIILFGSNTQDGIYYDKENDTYVASLEKRDEIDYFGYMKKIILTVHNIKMIHNNKLPIHGAGVSLLLKNGETKNVILVGDSGAGKSEVLETLRTLASDYIDDMKTIYDDMGTLEIIDNKVYTYGTEIGAFVRTNDLANDYVYNVFDRAIFLNPTGDNARLVLPVNNYQAITSLYPVDYILYANNYSDDNKRIRVFDNAKEAIKVFEKGSRVAMGTTNEMGLVETFFANPFGPVQLKEETTLLLDKYFDKLFENNVLVGEIETGLSLKDRQEKIQLATTELLELLRSKK